MGGSRCEESDAYGGNQARWDPYPFTSFHEGIGWFTRKLGDYLSFCDLISLARDQDGKSNLRSSPSKSLLHVPSSPFWADGTPWTQDLRGHGATVDTPMACKEAAPPGGSKSVG